MTFQETAGHDASVVEALETILKNGFEVKCKPRSRFRNKKPTDQGVMPSEQKVVEPPVGPLSATGGGTPFADIAPWHVMP